MNKTIEVKGGGGEKMPKMRLAKIIKAKLCNFVKKKRSVRNEKLEIRSK